MRYEGDRIDALESKLDELLRRVERLEQRAWFPAEPAPAPTPPAPERAAPAPVSRPAAPPPPPPPAQPAPARPGVLDRPLEFDLEELLGGRLLAWLGAVAIVLGIGFFFAMAVSRGWIDEPTRVTLAYVGSTLLLGAGLYLYERQGRTQAAIAAVAAAIAALYASTTAATQLYDLVDPVVGLAIAGLIGAVATAIAVRWNEILIGGIGILGALLAPVLVDAGTSGGALAFMGIALVSAAGVLIWQRWDWLAALAFIVSAPQLFAWALDARDDNLTTVLVVLPLFWALYVVAAIGYEVRARTEVLRPSSASLLLANAVLVSGVGWFVLDDAGHGIASTVWVIGSALAHFVLGSLTLRGRISREIALLVLAIAIGLSAIALALALNGPALVAAWSVEAVLLFWLARRTGLRRGYLAGGAFLALASVHMLAIDAQPDRLIEGFDATATVAVALVAAAAILAFRFYADPWEYGGLAVAAVGVSALAYLPPIALHGIWLVAAWSLEAIAFALAARIDEPRAAFVAPGFLALAAIHVLAFEAPPSGLRDGVDDLGLAVAGIAVVTASTFALLRLVDWRPDLLLALEIAGTAGLVYLPSILIVDLTTTGEEFEPGQTPQVLLSTFWALTGLTAFVFGLVRDDRRFRLGGLALLGVAIAKVYLYDLAALSEIFRVLSFILLGLLLLAGAFAYQRIRRTTQ
jgi:uncharacterized membrane protein